MYQFVIYHSLEFFFSILVATVHMHTKGHTSDSVKAKGIFNPFAFLVHMKLVWGIYIDIMLSGDCGLGWLKIWKVGKS